MSLHLCPLESIVKLKTNFPLLVVMHIDASSPVPSARSSTPFEIVVAHYNEDLTWLKEFRSETRVYCKGRLCSATASLCSRKSD